MEKETWRGDMERRHGGTDVESETYVCKWIPRKRAWIDSFEQIVIVLEEIMQQSVWKHCLVQTNVWSHNLCLLTEISKAKTTPWAFRLQALAMECENIISALKVHAPLFGPHSAKTFACMLFHFFESSTLWIKSCQANVFGKCCQGLCGEASISLVVETLIWKLVF